MLEHKLPQSAGAARQTDARTSARGGGAASEKANKRFSKDVLSKTRKLCSKWKAEEERGGISPPKIWKHNFRIKIVLYILYNLTRTDNFAVLKNRTIRVD